MLSCNKTINSEPNKASYNNTHTHQYAANTQSGKSDLASGVLEDDAIQSLTAILVHHLIAKGLPIMIVRHELLTT